MITKNIRLDLSLFPDPTLAERKWGVVIIRHPTWPLRGITKHHIRNHVLIMPYTVYYLCHVELHCGAHYSNNCAVIGHFTCQTAVTELGRMSYVTRPFSSPGEWGLDTRLLTEGWEMVWLDRLIRGIPPVKPSKRDKINHNTIKGHGTKDNRGHLTAAIQLVSVHRCCFSSKFS